MDYNYYIRALSTLPTSIHQQLIEHAQTTPLDIRRSYFNDRHPGFDSISMRGTDGYVENCDAAIRAVVDFLAERDWFPTQSFHAYEINELQPGGQILLHTDQTPTDTSFPYKVPHYHSVHLPLTPGGVYYWKRSYEEEWTIFRMIVGTAYSYNNYVLHRVENEGPDVRYNIVLHYWDPQWKLKKHLYEKLNIGHSRF